MDFIIGPSQKILLILYKITSPIKTKENWNYKTEITHSVHSIFLPELKL